MIGKLFAWLTGQPAAVKVPEPAQNYALKSEPEVKAQPSVQAEQIKEAVTESMVKPKRPRNKNTAKPKKKQ